MFQTINARVFLLFPPKYRRHFRHSSRELFLLAKIPLHPGRKQKIVSFGGAERIAVVAIAERQVKSDLFRDVGREGGVEDEAKFVLIRNVLIVRERVLKFEPIIQLLAKCHSGEPFGRVGVVAELPRSIPGEADEQFQIRSFPLDGSMSEAAAGDRTKIEFFRLVAFKIIRDEAEEFFIDRAVIPGTAPKCVLSRNACRRSVITVPQTAGVNCKAVLRPDLRSSEAGRHRDVVRVSRRVAETDIGISFPTGRHCSQASGKSIRTFLYKLGSGRWDNSFFGFWNRWFCGNGGRHGGQSCGVIRDRIRDHLRDVRTGDLYLTGVLGLEGDRFLTFFYYLAGDPVAIFQHYFAGGDVYGE